MYSCQFVIRFNSRGETQYSEFIKNILLSQCRGLKRVLAVVNCHFLKVLLLTWYYQPPAYENETSTIFWFIFLQQPYFQGFVGSWENYLSRAVSMLVYIWRSFPLRADCPKLTALSTALEAEFKFMRGDCKLSLLFLPASRAPRKSLLAILSELAAPINYQKWRCGKDRSRRS